MKITTKTNFRVVITPRDLGELGGCTLSDEMVSRNIEQDYQERCEEIAAQAIRHIDNVRHAAVEFDEDVACSHCCLPWHEQVEGDVSDYPLGIPLCCEKAQKEWRDKKMH